MSFWLEYLRILIRENREVEKEVGSVPQVRQKTSRESLEPSAKIKIDLQKHDRKEKKTWLKSKRPY
jgi:hypothetical protein